MAGARGGGRRAARAWHLITATAAACALALQVALVFGGAGGEGAPVALRLGRMLSFFTIQSTLLVLAATITLARDPERDGDGWRVLRVAGLAGIAVTGLVHFALLRPVVEIDGWDLICDRMLHVAVPLLAIVGWLLFGPRPRVTAVAVAWALVWPLVWLVWTLAVGALTGWYPYPFFDVDEKGWASVLGTAAAITALFLVLFGGAAAADRRLPSRHDRP